MVDIEWETQRCDRVTLIAAIVTNTHTTPQRVRIAPHLDGPTWPPRRDGVTVPAWGDGIWEGTIRPGRRRGVGFAGPAPAAEPPLELVAADRATTDREPTSDEVIASLGAWSPTADVLRDR